MKKLIINTVRESYSADYVCEYCEPLTVGELIEQLSEFDENEKVVLSFDKGYTYGAITEDRIYESNEE